MKPIKFKTFQKIPLPQRFLNWICGRGFNKYHFPQIGSNEKPLIMAAIGEKDKNGEDIYEGDILRNGLIVGNGHEEKII